MIIKTPDGYVISANGVWRPGVYSSERAAKYASKFPDEVLTALRAPISFEMLRVARNSMK